MEVLFFPFLKLTCLLFLDFMAICGDIYDVTETNSDMFNLYQIVVLLCTADLFFCQMWYNSSIKADKLFNSIIAMHWYEALALHNVKAPFLSWQWNILLSKISSNIKFCFVSQVVSLRISTMAVRWILIEKYTPKHESNLKGLQTFSALSTMSTSSRSLAIKCNSPPRPQRCSTAQCSFKAFHPWTCGKESFERVEGGTQNAFEGVSLPSSLSHFLHWYKVLPFGQKV